MKSLPHACRCLALLALAFGLWSSSALALMPALQMPTAPQLSAADEPLRLPHVTHIQQLRAERRERFEQAPPHSQRVLLPEFALSTDAPDDEDLADLRAEQLQYYPDLVQPVLREQALAPRLPPRDQLERPPRG